MKRKLIVQLVDLGAIKEFAHLPLFGESKVWQSVTPFVVHRQFKRSGTKRDVLNGNEPTFREAFLKLAAREIVERTHPGKLVTVEVAPARH